MKIKPISLLLLSAALTAGCEIQKTDTAGSGPAISKSEAIAEVNGSLISKAALEMLKQDIAKRAPGQSIPEEKLVEELVQREILVQQAIEKGLDKSPDFQTRLDAIRKSLLTQALLEDYMKTNPITDEDLKAEYNKLVGQESGSEYKARHILVKTEDEAKQIIAELDKGADFAELAKKKSTGPSAAKGGDLGWFAPQQMVPPFSEAVIALENNKYTSAPVQTQFGWHVILREDSRSKNPPPFDAIKEQLRPLVERRKVQEFIAQLRKDAKVEILTPPAEQQQPEAETAESEKPATEAEQPPAAQPAQPATESAPAAKPATSADAPAAEEAEVEAVQAVDEKAATATATEAEEKADDQ